MRKILASVAFVMTTFGVAFATHPGSSTAYVVLGTSADGKSIYFTKKSESVDLAEEWTAVYDSATGKLKTSQPTYRNCAPMNDAWDPKAECGDKLVQISRDTGKRSIE